MKWASTFPRWDAHSTNLFFCPLQQHIYKWPGHKILTCFPTSRQLAIFGRQFLRPNISAQNQNIKNPHDKISQNILARLHCSDLRRLCWPLHQPYQRRWDGRCTNLSDVRWPLLRSLLSDGGAVDSPSGDTFSLSGNTTFVSVVFLSFSNIRSLKISKLEVKLPMTPNVLWSVCH